MVALAVDFQVPVVDLRVFRAAEERAGLRVASVKVANVSQTTVSIRTFVCVFVFL